jgi:hypothetical protein
MPAGTPNIKIAKAEDKATVGTALKKRIAALQKPYPGLAVEEQDERFHIAIPEALRTGHEAHFALVCRRFLDYVRHAKSLPAWEKPNMLAKYYVTTQGIELARKHGAETATP